MRSPENRVACNQTILPIVSTIFERILFTENQRNEVKPMVNAVIIISFVR